MMERRRLFRHADGGLYVQVEDQLIGEMKMDDGRWEPSVSYRAVNQHGKFLSYADAKIFHTTRARFQERFTEIPRSPL